MELPRLGELGWVTQVGSAYWSVPVPISAVTQSNAESKTVKAERLLGIALLLGLIVLGAVLFVASLDHVQTIIMDRHSASPMSEEEALRLSSQALQRTVKGFAGYKAAPYNGTNFYARNHHDTNNGYVLWVSRTNAEIGFSVHMTVRDSKVLCEVTEFK